jgi:SET domain
MSLIETIVESDLTEIAEIRIDPITSARSLFSKKDFKANEVIIGFMARDVHSTPNYLTVQISEHEHIELFPECLECANHSCNPNCFFDTTSMNFVTLKRIKAGEEFTFFYPSAEWDMDQSFECNCGSSNCIGNIKGAKYLSDASLKTYRFTDFIQQKLRTRDNG